MVTNNAINLQDQGVAYYDGVSDFTGIDGVNAGYVLTSNGTGVAPSFQALAPSSESWVDISGTATLSANTNYFVTGASTLTLPASPSQGNFVRVIVATNASVVITANTGQIIRLSANATSTAGTFTNSLIGDSMVIVYRTTGAVWAGLAFTGAWTPA